MIRTDDITSSTDYRARQSEYHARLQATGRPLFITNRGKTEAVVLSPEAFNELQDRAELLASLEGIRRSEEDIAAGRVVEAVAGIREIARRHGLSLDR